MRASIVMWKVKQNAIPKNPAKNPTTIYANLITRM